MHAINCHSPALNVPCPACGEDFDILVAWLATNCKFTCPECGECNFHSDALLQGVTAAREFLRQLGGHFPASGNDAPRKRYSPRE
jgi:hypothetical protein